MAASPLDQVNVRIARSIRAHRQTRGLTVAALAAKAWVSKSSLTTIETGLGNPSVETLWRIASAMDVSLGEIIDQDEPPPTRIIRADEPVPIVSASGMTARLILGEGRNHRTEVYAGTLPAGADYRSEPHAAGAEELVICVEGRMITGTQLNEVELARGDALWFPADLPHRYHAVEDARMINVMSLSAGRRTSLRVATGAATRRARSPPGGRAARSWGKARSWPTRLVGVREDRADAS